MEHNMVLDVLESVETIPIESEIDNEILNAFTPMDLDSVFNPAEASEDVESVHLSDNPDAWHWDLANSKVFTVKETRLYIDDALLPDHLPETRWCRFIPKKVNILSWRALRDRLPNRWNLSRKGINIPSLLCPPRLYGSLSSDGLIFTLLIFLISLISSIGWMNRRRLIPLAKRSWILSLARLFG
ncbi:reverse transcriptase zinc-binding domain-containing protein [Artemisia annua]|uniref:Reverse transcriptase zinc-binding domain-containing protein n=1 Tax=Artemisia annua TaxID=35608 RepID=A0A2U1M5Y8_ARTAN|nr:reverse transcriptase zinc-binding domain-containing protein [Artemisia annua]